MSQTAFVCGQCASPPKCPLCPVEKQEITKKRVSTSVNVCYESVLATFGEKDCFFVFCFLNLYCEWPTLTNDRIVPNFVFINKQVAKQDSLH